MSGTGIKRTVNDLLEEQFGTKSSLEFKEMGKKKVYAFKKCGLDIKTEHYGLYFGKLEKNGLRLSIEGSQFIGPSARRGVFEVDENKAMRWMCGEDIEGEVRGYVLIRWGNYFLGCGKGNGEKIRNFIPKGRRISPDSR